MGFTRKWISWIKQCTGSPSYSIVVNDAPNGYIVSSRGLRQGDPLSPYLFTLAMEAFTVLVEIEVKKGSICLPRTNYGVSNLIFADDVLVFCRGDCSSLSTVANVFKTFADLSGLITNKDKSVLFLSKSCSNRTELLQRVGFKEGCFPMRYLGVPLLDRKLRHIHCSTLLELLKDRIASWRNKLLSFAGHLELIKSVLCSCVTHWTMVFDIPVRTIAKFNSILSNFL